MSLGDAEANAMKPQIKILPLLLLALGLLVGCGSSPSATDPSATGGDRDGGKASEFNSPARFTLELGRVGALAKGNAIVMRKLILVAASNAIPADTIRDTSFLDGAGGGTVKRVMKLKPKISWTVLAKTLDLRDSVIHSGATQPFIVKPADTADVSLSLAARYVMYQAVFGSLPYSVSASVDGTERMAVNLNRVSLKIDGVVKADSLAKGYFTPGQDVSLNFDYVSPGRHTVTLEAYGIVNGWMGLLFSGTGTLSSNPGEDGSKPITLTWVGPNTGSGRVSVILGRVGKVVLMGGFTTQL